MSVIKMIMKDRQRKGIIATYFAGYQSSSIMQKLIKQRPFWGPTKKFHCGILIIILPVLHYSYVIKCVHKSFINRNKIENIFKC